MRLLEDVQAEKQKAIERDIQQNVEKHMRWNEGFVDKTRAPLTPISPKSFASNSDFRQAMPTTEYLPTPPASVSDESMQNDNAVDSENPKTRAPTPFRYASPSEDDSNTVMPSFRRRIGRGGRMMFDRRIPFRLKEVRSDVIAERYLFDSDDEMAEDITPADDQDMFHRMTHRAYLFGKARDPDAAHAQAQQAQAQALAQAARRAQLESAVATNAQTLPSATPNITPQVPARPQPTTSS